MQKAGTTARVRESKWPSKPPPTWIDLQFLPPSNRVQTGPKRQVICKLGPNWVQIVTR